MQRQRMLFDNEREMIEYEFRDRVVGYVTDERLIDDKVVALLDRVQS